MNLTSRTCDGITLVSKTTTDMGLECTLVMDDPIKLFSHFGTILSLVSKADLEEEE